MKNKKIILAGVLLTVLMGLFFILPPVQAAEDTCSGVVGCIPTSITSSLSSKTVKDILVNLLNWLLGIVGVIALIGFVVSGIQYIVSTGNDKMMESAKKNMMYSLIGITVALAAYVIIRAIDAILKASITI